MDGCWLEVVLGGTFLKNDPDLTIRPKTVRQLLYFWLHFFHFGSTQYKADITIERLINRVMLKLGIFENSEPKF